MSNQEILPPIPAEYRQTCSELQQEVKQLRQEQATSSARIQHLVSEMLGLSRKPDGKESQPEVTAQLTIKVAQLKVEHENATALLAKIDDAEARLLIFTERVQRLAMQYQVAAASAVPPTT